ncbi:DUF805 domain-containing protein [Leifsonia poae]|uniref:DUF805 domain-containing protein n=2 Tax=Leifsonia poae TaxID=110933 RepID=A0A9W6LZY6_9MICO|nr:DUF805 domain-containing protein [Leifsonia poae]GLJ76321.1 hypothetical protein GCM10017584_18950 [Leifsonia poae]
MTPSTPLWAPYYAAPLIQSVRRFWRKYARFDGRASRSEYWWWALANAVVVGAIYLVMLLGGLAGSTTDAEGRYRAGPGLAVGVALLVLWGLATLVPSIALHARRLHDVDLSAWLLLLVLVPSLGALAIFVMTLLPPNPRGARFDRPDDEIPGYVADATGAQPTPREFGWPDYPLPYASPAGGQPLYAEPRNPPAPPADTDPDADAP